LNLNDLDICKPPAAAAVERNKELLKRPLITDKS